MRLDVRALAAVGAVVLGATFGLTALVNLGFPTYGLALLDVAVSLYPGYHGPGGLGGVLVVTLYGALDGAVGGAVVAWVYNAVARPARG